MRVSPYKYLSGLFPLCEASGTPFSNSSQRPFSHVAMTLLDWGPSYVCNITCDTHCHPRSRTEGTLPPQIPSKPSRCLKPSRRCWTRAWPKASPTTPGVLSLLVSPLWTPCGVLPTCRRNLHQWHPKCKLATQDRALRLLALNSMCPQPGARAARWSSGTPRRGGRRAPASPTPRASPAWHGRATATTWCQAPWTAPSPSGGSLTTHRCRCLLCPSCVHGKLAPACTCTQLVLLWRVPQPHPARARMAGADAPYCACQNRRPC